jgi:hypothetical protein
MPADDAAAAQDGVPDHRRGNDLVVHHDGKALAHVLGSRITELARANRIELERHHRQAALIEGLLRIRQIFAGH